MMIRRRFLAALAAAPLAACARPAAEMAFAPVTPAPAPALRPTDPAPAVPDAPPLPARYGAIPDEPFPVPAVPEGVVDPRLWRQEVETPDPTLAAGSILVDPDRGYLFLIEPGGRALRYGVGVGGAGFAWNGDARVQFTRAWPTWRVPDEMIARRPELEPYSVANGGMPPGPDNPLGARALYLFQNGEDTLYRIHGACEPQYLGRAVSSGCIRMLDQDVIDLEERTPHGATVRVLPSLAEGRLGALY
ncbi:L,D-transpeptidase [Wenxinia saemankumensis]|uniref:Lipoprotein-anchoring transpeptidase ErfK/SrfK n=1 Tax=Wenxinia saemankumensis TaxID=1447782 RepID=A0A1M6AUS9_9RHOB|nr:L,D-transpeptidase [Wenxinia saemankumensis]SHI40187.1 Lipoprotein-anchoring transpeptidase ErfK/SrfK [Wenxinia saemankumensis]